MYQHINLTVQDIRSFELEQVCIAMFKATTEDIANEQLQDENLMFGDVAGVSQSKAYTYFALSIENEMLIRAYKLQEEDTYNRLMYGDGNHSRRDFLVLGIAGDFHVYAQTLKQMAAFERLPLVLATDGVAAWPIINNRIKLEEYNEKFNIRLRKAVADNQPFYKKLGKQYKPKSWR